MKEEVLRLKQAEEERKRKEEEVLRLKQAEEERKRKEEELRLKQKQMEEQIAIVKKQNKCYKFSNKKKK